MYAESIELEDAGLSIGGEQFAAFAVSAVCEYENGEKGFAEFQQVRSISLSLPNVTTPISIDRVDLDPATQDAIDAAVQPLFEAWMDQAGDVSPADADRIADRIDGYDRDDLGESPDF